MKRDKIGVFIEIYGANNNNCAPLVSTHVRVALQSVPLLDILILVLDYCSVGLLLESELKLATCATPADQDLNLLGLTYSFSSIIIR